MKQRLTMNMMGKLAAAGLLAAGACAHAGTWTPLAGSGKARTVEVSSSATFPIPASLAARGAVMRLTLVGGGEGGHSSRGSCDDYAIQGGKGGDGGEVIEVDVTLQPGQCAAGLTVAVGPGGRGAFRGGNAAANGESGGPTTVGCSGTPIASALGGGRRADAVTASRSAKGGVGGAVMNTLDQVGSQTIEQRSTAITPGADGQVGRGGYGSGGGGGGASVQLTGSSMKADGTVLRRTTTRNAPMGKGGYGGGAGAGPAEYGSDANTYVAENAAQYGAGGGGGAAMCAASGASREGGNGYQGLVRIQWTD